MKKAISLIILLFAILNCLKSQLPETKMIKIGKDTLYYTQPITNREYITFLIHNYRIFGESYNNYIYSLFPLVKISYSDAISEAYVNQNYLEMLIRNSDTLVRNYIFNPKYLDYPVIGISQFQANYFAQWYTDRLNEYILIDERIIISDFLSEVDENHFSTESYLMHQFEPTQGDLGITNKIKGLKYAMNQNDTMNAISKLFTLGFRLPTFYELKNLAASEKPVFKSYPKKDFLQMWNDSFISIKEDKLICKIYNDFMKFDSKIIPKIQLHNELSFGSYKDSSLLKVFSNELMELNSKKGIDINDRQYDKEKNEYGYMEYRFIGYNEHSELLILFDKKEKWSRNGELKPFRLVFNKRITTGMEKRIEYIPMPK